jgi:hypothetical protein
MSPPIGARRRTSSGSIEAFSYDTPVEPTLQRARRAQGLNIKNVIITGRYTSLNQASEGQLTAQGLTPHELLARVEGQSPRSPQFKVEEALARKRAGLQLPLFVTDSVDEIAAMQAPEVRAQIPEMVCVLVVVPPNEPDLKKVRSDTPIWRT